jgi:hypothetical protein
MSKVVRDITTSLDGFMADPNDDVERLHDWLFSGNTPSAYNDFGSGWLRGKAVGPEKRERLGEGAAPSARTLVGTLPIDVPSCRLPQRYGAAQPLVQPLANVSLLLAPFPWIADQKAYQTWQARVQARRCPTSAYLLLQRLHAQAG